MKIIPLSLALGFVMTFRAMCGPADGGNLKRGDAVSQINRGIVKRSAGEPESAGAEPSWSPQAAGKYADGRLESWLAWSGAARGEGTACVSCHTALPFALARPALGARLGEAAAGAVESRLIDNVKKRVENWVRIVSDSTSHTDHFLPFYSDMKTESLGTESVLNALILVNDDRSRAKVNLSAATKEALGHLWEEQQENGAWLWLDFGLDPWEKNGTYYGTSLAALAAGMAGENYYHQAGIQAKVAALRRWLLAHYANQPLHHRIVCLWASSWLPGLLTAMDREGLIIELLNAQEDDGGWSLPKLGRQISGTARWNSNDANSEGMVSDGYATGLVVLALKRAGLTADNPKLKKGTAWLVANERNGTWPASYLNKPRDPQTNIGMFMRDAATAFAILALTEPTQSGSGRE